MKKLIKWFKKLFKPTKKKKEKPVRKNEALTKADYQYLSFLITKKKKSLKKRGKRFSPKHRKELIQKIKETKYEHQTRVEQTSSGWGFFEYYLLFNWMSNPVHSHYYSNDSAYTDSPSFEGGGGSSGGGGSDGSWDDNSNNSDCDTSDSSSDNCDSSSDYSDSSSYDSGSYDSGSSYDSGGSSDSSF